MGVLPSHAAWYAVPPHPPNSLDDRTLAWGPIALFMCEAQERPGENPYNVVRNGSHGARLIHPNPLALLVRLDWAGPTEANSRCRPLTQSCGMGDCAFALHLAGYDHPDLRQAAERRDQAATTRRTADAAMTWPPPEALYCHEAARRWAERQFDTATAAAMDPQQPKGRRSMSRFNFNPAGLI